MKKLDWQRYFSLDFKTDLFSFILNAAGKYRQTCNKLDFCRFQITARDKTRTTT